MEKNIKRMVDFLLNLLIDILNWLIGFLPSIDSGNTFYLVWESLTTYIIKAFAIGLKIPFAKVFFEAIIFVFTVEASLFVYKGVAWIYNLIRGRAD